MMKSVSWVRTDKERGTNVFLQKPSMTKTRKHQNTIVTWKRQWPKSTSNKIDIRVTNKASQLQVDRRAMILLPSSV